MSVDDLTQLEAIREVAGSARAPGLCAKHGPMPHDPYHGFVCGECLRESTLITVKRDCIIGAHQTLDMVDRTLQHAESLELARAALVPPVQERMLLLQQILESDDSGPAPRPLPGPEDPPDPVGLTSASGDE